jgi:16S rRNA (guanine(966)-N(2))-methyltransferase RsmD
MRNRGLAASRHFGQSLASVKAHTARGARRANAVRIIGGSWRGRVVRFNESDALRPTPDRVRETLFNWLGQDLSGRRCLDLFAGSGALGLESLSRSAAHVDFVDRSRQVCRRIGDTACDWGATRFRVHCCDALEFLEVRANPEHPMAPREQWDVAYLDPPFGKGLVSRCLELLAPLLNPGARVYFESEGELSPPQGWSIVRSGKAGMVRYGLVVWEKT